MGRRQALCTNDKGEPIRILHVGHHFCIRNIKQARALKKKGYKLDALTNRISYGTNEYERVFYYHSKEQFRNTLEMVASHYDIIQVANEPDWMLVVADNMRADGYFNVPLVHDCHDLDSVRIAMANLDEVRVFNKADGVIFVSQPCRDFALELHEYDMPDCVLYHHCNENWVDYNAEVDARRSGIVYEGGANPPQTEAQNPFKYRSIYHVMRGVVEMGNELHMFIGNVDGYETYQDIGAVIYPPTPYDQMMEGMLLRKWGALMFNNEDLTEPQTNLTTMNKAYEYIMCGLPVICLGAPEQARVLKKYGVTIELEKLADLGNVEQNYGHLYPELKANVDKARKVLTMERHIHVVEKLYKTVLENTHSKNKKA